MPDAPALLITVAFSEPPKAGHPGRRAGDIWFITPAETGASGRGPLVFVSLGQPEDFHPETARRAGGKLASWLLRHKAERAGLDASRILMLGELGGAQAFFEGLLLGGFRFQNYKTGSAALAPVQIDIFNAAGYDKITQAIDRAEAIAGGVNLARAWGHEPPNCFNPLVLAERLEDLAARRGLKCRILGREELEELGAGAILATGAGSRSPPRMVILEHAVKPGDRPVVIAGKAITFDSGGYTLKSRAALVGMKYDKSGGLAVAGILQAIAALKLVTPVIGVIAAAENMISEHAYRPNDIVTSMSGKTIEIISTDAEGRMVLADALTYASTYCQPRLIVDLASLTSGVVTSLGRLRAGLFSNHDGLADMLFQAGERTHERLWRLPLDEEYAKMIQGDDSDMKNSSLVSQATAVVGAKFLEQFVGPDIPWAHLDIAGTHKTPDDGAYKPKGATGFGVRLLVDFLEALQKEGNGL